MSAIGEYVHYNIANYMAVGIARKGHPAKIYNGTMANYLKSKMSINNMLNESQVTILNSALQRNNLTAVQKDVAITNLHYGRKVNQYKRDIENELIGNNNMQNNNEVSIQVLEDKERRYYELQQKINEINSRKNITQKELQSLINSYHYLNSGNQSVLGGIQTGYNDYAYNIWSNKLKGDFGKQLKDIELKQAKNKVLEEIKLNVSGKNTTVSVNKSAAGSYRSTDAVGSIYNVDCIESGMSINVQTGRRHILKNVNQFFGKQAQLPEKLYGYSNLNEVLNEVEKYKSFGTHWLNLHAATFDISLDNQLKQAIAYDAFIKNKKQQGDYFIAIDTIKGNAVIKDLNDLVLNKIYQVYVQPSLHAVKLKNDWAGSKHSNYKDAMTRIGKVIQQTHNMNLQVAIRL